MILSIPTLMKFYCRCFSSCKRCHQSCKECFGEYSNQCLECRRGMIMRSDRECSWTCPPGAYYKDIKEQICKPCHPACTQCFGPSHQECHRCVGMSFCYCASSPLSAQSVNSWTGGSGTRHQVSQTSFPLWRRDNIFQPIVTYHVL